MRSARVAPPAKPVGAIALGLPLLLLMMVIIGTASGFNLEARLPVVKYGAPGSYFGYSVAEHVEKNSEGTKWILVGAPLGHNLQPNTTRSGALFKCPISQHSDDCEQVITDGRLEIIDGKNENNPDSTVDELWSPFEEEIKEDQWLGVTVRSQPNGGKVLVCAHRYISKTGSKETEAQHGQGLCYLLNNELGFEDDIKPCAGRATARSHEDYSFCQAGTASAIFEDGTMALGAPGLFNWRGTIFVQAVGGPYLGRDHTTYYGPHTETVSPVDKYSYMGMSVTGGHYFAVNQMVYASGAPRANDTGEVVFYSKLRKNPSDVNAMMEVVQRLHGEQFASNFGYEMCTADVNGDDMPDLLVSAPMYFNTVTAAGGAVYLYQNVGHQLGANYTLRLTGQPESRFGQALANLGDLNGDRCDDVAVGAPYEGNGVVYVFLGSKKGLVEKPSQVIRAADVAGVRLPGGKPLSTFGSSLAAGVDLDDNQYPDLVVGAFDAAVTVALLARPITNISTEVTMTELRNIDPKARGCASDREANTTCFAFKACCAIELYEGGVGGGGASHVDGGKQLQLEYVIEAETFDQKKKFSRVYFNKQRTGSNVVRKSVWVTTNGRKDCQEEIVYVKEGTRDIQSPIKFRLSYKIVEAPLASSALIALNPILDQTQADRFFEATFQKDCGDNDVCESDLYVNAELDLERDQNQYILVLGEADELRLNVTVTNSRESAYEAQLFVEHPATISYIGATKTSPLLCNRHNSTTVSCTLGNPLRRIDVAKLTLRFDPSGLGDSQRELSLRLFANSTSREVAPQPPTRLAVRIVKKVELSVRGRARPEQSFYGGAVRGEAAMRHLEDIGPLVLHTYQIYNDGPWRAPSVEVYIAWPHQVANDKAQGKWLLYLEEAPTVEGADGGVCEAVSGSSVINPLRLERRPKVTMAAAAASMAPASLRMLDEGLLGEDDEGPQHGFGAAMRFGRMKPVEKEEEGDDAVERLEEENRTMLTTAERENGVHHRVRRDRSQVLRAEKLVDKEGKKKEIVTMDCDKKSAKCIQLKCTIYNVQRKTEAYIHVRSRLWNATLVADYPRVDQVNIVSSATIKVPAIFDILQNHTDDRTVVETRAYPEVHDAAVESPSVWIIILSVLGGLLLLALFTFCLWKLGFFKRRRPDPTLSGNLEKSHSKHSENKLLLQPNGNGGGGGGKT